MKSKTISDLPHIPDRNELIIKLYDLGMKYRDIAKILNIPFSTATSVIIYKHEHHRQKDKQQQNIIRNQQIIEYTKQNPFVSGLTIARKFNISHRLYYGLLSQNNIKRHRPQHLILKSKIPIIKKMLNKHITQMEIAHKLNVSSTSISAIKKGWYDKI